MSKDQDIAAVKSLFQVYETALTAGDASRIAADFTHDAVVIPGVASVLNGREEIKSWYQDVLVQFKVMQTTNFDEFEFSGDSGLVPASFTTVFTPKGGGKTTSLNGKGMLIYKRQADGSWKTARVGCGSPITQFPAGASEGLLQVLGWSCVGVSENSSVRLHDRQAAVRWRTSV